MTPSWFEMTLRFRINRIGWLTLGTIYGAMVGDIIGVVGTRTVASRYFPEQARFPSVIVGALVGLAIGVCLDVEFCRAEDQAPHLRSTLIPRERVLFALPIVWLIYTFLASMGAAVE